MRRMLHPKLKQKNGKLCYSHGNTVHVHMQGASHWLVLSCTFLKKIKSVALATAKPASARVLFLAMQLHTVIT